MTAGSVNTLPFRNVMIVGCPKDGDTQYSVTTGINIAAADYDPGYIMNALILTAGSGNIALELENGGAMTLPFTVDSGKCSIELWGVRIKKVKKAADGTTFTGYIFPQF